MSEQFISLLPTYYLIRPTYPNSLRLHNLQQIIYFYFQANRTTYAVPIVFPQFISSNATLNCTMFSRKWKRKIELKPELRPHLQKSQSPRSRASSEIEWNVAACRLRLLVSSILIPIYDIFNYEVVQCTLEVEIGELCHIFDSVL